MPDERIAAVPKIKQRTLENQGGSLQIRGGDNPTWRGRFYVRAVDPNGKPRFICKSIRLGATATTSAEEAEKGLQDAIAASAGHVEQWTPKAVDPTRTRRRKEQTTGPSEKLLTPKQAAQVLDVSEGWVRDHAEWAEPRIPTARSGRPLRFRLTDLNNFKENFSRRPVSTVKPLSGKQFEGAVAIHANGVGMTEQNGGMWNGCVRYVKRDAQGERTEHTSLILLGLRKYMTREHAEAALSRIVAATEERLRANGDPEQEETAVLLNQIIAVTEVKVKEDGASRAANLAAANDSDAQTLGWFWRERFRPMREPIWKESARNDLVRGVELYVLRRFGDVPMSKISRTDVQMHLNDLATAGYSHGVVDKARVWTKALLTEAHAQHLISYNPTSGIRLPKTKKVSKKTLSIPEIDALIREMQPSEATFVRLCLVLGLRPGEALALRWNDLEGDTLRIDEASRHGELHEPKTEASNASMVLPAALAEQLKHLRENSPFSKEEDFIFPNSTGGVMRLDNFRHRVLDPAAKRAGLTGVTFQAMRRTCATMLCGAETNIKDIQVHLRHSKASTTLGIYVQPVSANLRKAVEALHNILTGGREKENKDGDSEA